MSMSELDPLNASTSQNKLRLNRQRTLILALIAAPYLFLSYLADALLDTGLKCKTKYLKSVIVKSQCFTVISYSHIEITRWWLLQAARVREDCGHGIKLKKKINSSSGQRIRSNFRKVCLKGSRPCHWLKTAVCRADPTAADTSRDTILHPGA